MKRIYVYNSNPNGTADLVIVDEFSQVIDGIQEAVFVNLPSKQFGWSGDALGNIDVCFYGESIGMVSYDTPYDEENTDDERTLAEAVQSGEISDLAQVIEVSLEDVLEHIAVSPVSDGSETLSVLSKYFDVKGA